MAAPSCGREAFPPPGFAPRHILETASGRVISYAPPQVQEARPAAGFHAASPAWRPATAVQRTAFMGNSRFYSNTLQAELQLPKFCRFRRAQAAFAAGRARAAFGIFRKWEKGLTGGAFAGMMMVNSSAPSYERRSPVRHPPATCRSRLSMIVGLPPFVGATGLLGRPPARARLPPAFPVSPPASNVRLRLVNGTQQYTGSCLMQFRRTVAPSRKRRCSTA
jgi:hypothetical protein